MGMKSKKPTIGCLALQGCVDRHAAHIEAAGADFRPVKTAKQFAEVDAFILPGGESTTMLKLIERFELWDTLSQQFAEKPVWGICAGSILLAKDALYKKTVSGALSDEAAQKQKIDTEDKLQNNDEWDKQKSFEIMSYTAVRNGYGRQLESDIVAINGYDVSFIRAPVLKNVDANITIHATYENDPVWVQDGKNMASTFHPELTFDFPSPMHKAFVALVKDHMNEKPA